MRVVACRQAGCASSEPASAAASSRACAATKFCSAGSSSDATRDTASSRSRTRWGKASRKKPEMRTVTSIRGRPSSCGRDDLDAGHAARLARPHRPHAEQREDLGGVVALGAHGARAPGDEADHPRQLAVVCDVALEQRLRQPPARLPRQLRRQRPGIDRIEVAPGRQDVDAAARRAAARPGGDVAAVQRGEHVRELVGRPGQPRDDGLAGEAQRVLHVGVGAPEPVAHDLRDVERRPPARRQRAEQRRLALLQAVGAGGRGERVVVEPEHRRERRAQARHVTRAEPQHGADEAALLVAGGRHAEHVQPVLDLDVLDLAEVAVDVLDELAEVVGALGHAEVGLQVRALDRVPDLRRRGPAAWAGRGSPGARTRRAAPRARPARRRSRRASSAGRGGRRSPRARGAWPARPRRGR